MWEWIVETLRRHAERALLLTHVLGYWIGSVTLGAEKIRKRR
jgi:hypothetical protein